jgi:ATP-dependent DNA helicase RecQ
MVELLASPADVPTLENFAYGDTPTPDAIRAVLAELLGSGPAFDVSVADLSSRFDIRQLVMRTVLTYLELLGVFRQGTPFYAGYEARPMVELDVLLSRFAIAQQRFIAAMFAAAKKGRLWYHIDSAGVASRLATDRERVVRALHYLEERRLIELRTNEPRLRFTREYPDPVDQDSLVETLAERFHRREQQEILRIQQVLALVEHAGCQTNALTSYFGQPLTAPCGHCTFCNTGRPSSLSAVPPPPPIDSLLDLRTFAALRQSHPESLGSARQQARFLCGLTGPALIQARLTSNPLFGILQQHPFADVLARLSDSEARG